MSQLVCYVCGRRARYQCDDCMNVACGSHIYGVDGKPGLHVCAECDEEDEEE